MACSFFENFSPKRTNVLESFFSSRGFNKYFPWVLLILGALIRLWALDLKPPHFDEGINGWFADVVQEQGFYAYDPTNYHGPLFFYLLFLVQHFFGRNLWALRMPSLLASIMMVWLALRFESFLGRNAARWGALALALSPAMVFYGRYAIHESWVAMSLMILLLGLLGLGSHGDRRSLLLSLLGVTLLLLLKETLVIHLLSLMITTVLLLLGSWWYRSKKSSALNKKLIVEKEPFFSPLITQQQWTYWDLGVGALISLLLLFLFYSGGFLYLRGFLNLCYALPAWIHTGIHVGGHTKLSYQLGPLNYYWLALMLRYELPALLGFGYALWLTLNYHVKLFSPDGTATYYSENNFSSFHNYLSLYALGTFAGYSLIPYKTPWCIISIIWPLTLLFGVFLEKIRPITWRFILGFLVLGISFFLCLRLNFWHYVDFSEPYVYVQTSPEIKLLTEPLLLLAKKNPRYFQLRGQILLESYFPLPWILHDFKSFGYYSKSNMPKEYDADIIVVELSRSAAIEKQLQGYYYRREFQLRDSMEKCVVFFKKKTFEDFFDHQNLPTPNADSINQRKSRAEHFIF